MASGLRCDPKATGSAVAPSRRNRARMPDNRALTSDSGWTWTTAGLAMRIVYQNLYNLAAARDRPDQDLQTRGGSAQGWFQFCVVNLATARSCIHRERAAAVQAGAGEVSARFKDSAECGRGSVANSLCSSAVELAA